jgi:opacity protein-like surface antigen
MPKTKILFFLLILFFSKNLNARTVGNYVGIDIIKTALSFSSERTVYETNKIEKSIHSVPSPSYSFGFKYNYALNYRGFFISPGLIYEKNNNKGYFNSANNAESETKRYGKSYSKINQRLGTKLDLGADITGDFSIYGTLGYALNYYESYNSLYEDRYYNYYNTGPKDGFYKVTNNPWKLNRGKKWAPFFGGGFRIKLYKNWLLNGEYNYTRFTFDTKAQEQTVIATSSGQQSQEDESTKKLFNNNIQIIKLGINYNF